MATEIVLVVDVANVMGSRPDGWWRDRLGAARRLLDQLAPLVGSRVAAPDGRPWLVRELLAVVEGQARGVTPTEDVPGLRIVRAPRDGDSAIAEQARQYVSDRETVVVVTADRGLRARIPAPGETVGPRWLWDAVDGS